MCINESGFKVITFYVAHYPIINQIVKQRFNLITFRPITFIQRTEFLIMMSGISHSIRVIVSKAKWPFEPFQARNKF